MALIPSDAGCNRRNAIQRQRCAQQESRASNLMVSPVSPRAGEMR